MLLVQPPPLLSGVRTPMSLPSKKSEPCYSYGSREAARHGDLSMAHVCMCGLQVTAVFSEKATQGSHYRASMSLLYIFIKYIL